MDSNEEQISRANDHFRNKSEPRELEHFVKSALFEDFQRIMRDRVAVLQNEMLVADRIEDLKKLQGEILGIMFWQILPERLVHFNKQVDMVEKLKEEQKDGTGKQG